MRRTSDFDFQEAVNVHLAEIRKLKLGQGAELQGLNLLIGEANTIAASKAVKCSGSRRFKESFQ